MFVFCADFSYLCGTLSCSLFCFKFFIFMQGKILGTMGVFAPILAVMFRLNLGTTTTGFFLAYRAINFFFWLFNGFLIR